MAGGSKQWSMPARVHTCAGEDVADSAPPALPAQPPTSTHPRRSDRLGRLLVTALCDVSSAQLCLEGFPDFWLIDFLYLGIIMSRHNENSTHITYPFATTLSPKPAAQHKNGRFGRGMMFRFHFAILVVGEVVFLPPMAIIRAQATQAFSKCTNKAMEKTFLQPSPQKIAWKRNLSWQHSSVSLPNVKTVVKHPKIYHLNWLSSKCSEHRFPLAPWHPRSTWRLAEALFIECWKCLCSKRRYSIYI